MEKFRRDRLVAVIYSSAYGLGWYSHHGVESLLYDPAIIHQLLMVQDAPSKVQCQQWIRQYLTHDPQWLHVQPPQELAIAWVPQGERFRIGEYDGLETVRLEINHRWLQA